jgi:hypothetical protein
MTPTRAAWAVIAIAMAVGLATLVSGCAGSTPLSKDWSPKSELADGLTRIAHTEGKKLLLSTQGGVVDFVPGVNLGSTIPGYQPGELAASAEDYRRWFPQMASLGLHAVRVYTILPPAFYEELAAFDRANPQKALYLIQGVWIPEDQFLSSQDLFDPAVHDGFKTEIGDAVAAVHGTLERSQRRGVAWGRWTADVSQWLYAYSIGVEWDPVATSASDTKNAGRPSYRGTYFSSTDAATPTEIWLAEMLDFTAEKEAGLGDTMPLTFTNWPTTDPLRHQEEPMANEDLVGVDANHIAVSPQWPGGYFASYHAYPYYPDFQRYEPGLQTATYDGENDPYAGYLEALQDHYGGMPVMITEFGVPSSMSLAHYGPLGRDQGNHSEQEEMAIDAQLIRMIHDLGFAGGLVFEWTDEWFKFTWNTIDYELPADRRQLWVNLWTNEEHFGLVAMDPGAAPVVTIDGKGTEWTDNSSQVIYEGRSGLREVRAVKDEGYLYLRLILDDPGVWKKAPITIGLDVLSGGNGGLPSLPGQDPEADYAIVLGPGKIGQAYVRASNDQFAILYGKGKGYVTYSEAALQEGSGVWDPEELITNKPQTIPSTQEKLPAESFNAGQMRYGTTDPSKKDFDCRAAWRADQCVEIRLPYEAIGFSDPSSLQALRVGLDGALTTEPVSRVEISVSIGSTLYQTNGYGWDPWQKVAWHERIKAGAEVYARAIADVTSR